MGEILRLDRWLHLGFSLYLPGNVDLQAGVRRVWSRHCPPQMLLSHSLIPQQSYVFVVYFFLSNLLFPLFEKKRICIQNLTGKICPIKDANVISFVSFLLFLLKKKKRSSFFKKKKKKKKKK